MRLDIALRVVAQIDRTTFLETWYQEILCEFNEKEIDYLPQVQRWLMMVDQEAVFKMLTLEMNDFDLRVNKWNDDFTLLVETFNIQVTEGVSLINYRHYIACEILLSRPEICPTTTEAVTWKIDEVELTVFSIVKGEGEKMELNYARLSKGIREIRKLYGNVNVFTYLDTVRV